MTNLISNKLQWPAWPKYDAEHEQAVLRVIRSNQLFAAQEVAEFEREFANYVGSTYAVGVGNATQGLHLALAALGVGIGDEVIVTPYSWISSASCVLMQHAVPVFVDIEPTSFGICPEALINAITQRTKAVILVHMFGLASYVEEIRSICAERGLQLIEDASHAHGAKLNGQHLGTFGDIGVFSLHQRKAIPTGDGGMLCTDKYDHFENLKKMRSFGAQQLSYNYRMTEFSAALGRIGLKKLDVQNEIRRRNHDILVEHLDHDNIEVVQPRVGVDAVYYSNLLKINLEYDVQLTLLRTINDLGIPLKRTWQPLHLHPHFRRENMPNLITPWDDHDRTFVEPRNKTLPIAELLQTSRLFELDCHPLVNPVTVRKAAEQLSQVWKA
jgi:perosamine synthetase